MFAIRSFFSEVGILWYFFVTYDYNDIIILKGNHIGTKISYIIYYNEIIPNIVKILVYHLQATQPKRRNR